MDIIEQTEASATTVATDIEASSDAPTAPTFRITKSAAVTKLLSRKRGATLNEIMAITHWQPHSTRAFLTGLRKKGVDLLRETRSGGETSYRIDR